MKIDNFFAELKRRNGYKVEVVFAHDGTFASDYDLLRYAAGTA
jgi:hypothetical protein